MRIGLYGGAATPDKIVEQAQQAEADGFSSLWYASGVLGDPLVAMALAGRATSTIELGTAVLQTYPCHPLLQAHRAASVAAAMGRPGFTLGVGPSHESNMSGIYGLSYDHPGRNTEEYVRMLTALLRGEDVEFEGEDWTVRHAGRGRRDPHPIPRAALRPRRPGCCASPASTPTGRSSGWRPPAAIEEHVTPRITAAAAARGSPCAPHRRRAPARRARRRGRSPGRGRAGAAMYADRPNYRRIMEVGRASGAGEAAIVGDETAVEAQLAGPVRRRRHRRVRLRPPGRRRPPCLPPAVQGPAAEAGHRVIRLLNMCSAHEGM